MGCKQSVVLDGPPGGAGNSPSRAYGGLRAVASLTEQRIALIRSAERGEVEFAVTITAVPFQARLAFAGFGAK
ncbi:MAG: hypothetical protein PVG42_14295 [Lysobacterales bacterium]|jgi:hypothetical protein